jgi:hypothetical protein
MPVLFMHFCLNAHYQFTPLLNLCSLFFGLTPFGWFISFESVFCPSYKFHSDTPNQGTKKTDMMTEHL